MERLRQIKDNIKKKISRHPENSRNYLTSQSTGSQKQEHQIWNADQPFPQETNNQGDENLGHADKPKPKRYPKPNIDLIEPKAPTKKGQSTGYPRPPKNWIYNR